jgi:DNA-binding beta-propeller fold protein YncE
VGLLARVAMVTAGLAAGCAPAGPGAAGGPTRLYAVNALDGTLTPVDGERAAVAGPPLPAGDAPVQAAPGPDGSLLVLAVPRDRPAGLTHVVRDRGAWRARPVALGAALHQAALAADGGRYAAVAHHTPTRLPAETGRPAPPAGAPEGRCRLTLVDLTAGETRTHVVCGPGEQVAGVALRAGPSGPVVYLGIRDPRGPEAETGDARAPAAPGPGAPRPPRDRVAAVDARTGRVLAVRALVSPPERLHFVPFAPDTGAPEGRLYVLEGAPGAESEYAPLGRWRLLGLHPATLETEQEAVLGVQVRALAVAPDGAHAYAVAAGGRDVLHLELASGVTRRLGALPGNDSGTIAVTARHVFAPNPLGSEVWALDRRDGRLAATIPVGRRPVAVVAARL